MHLSFPKKSICKIFHSFSSCWEVSYFQHITITLATNKKSKMKKFADSVWKKKFLSDFIFLPSFPPCPGWGPGHTPTRYTLRHSFPAGCRHHISNSTFQCSHATPGFCAKCWWQGNPPPKETNWCPCHKESCWGFLMCFQAVFPHDYYTPTSS